MATKHYTIKLTEAEMDALKWVWIEGYRYSSKPIFLFSKEVAAARRAETKIFRAEFNQRSQEDKSKADALKLLDMKWRAK
tara:strand:+ start:184 stop:423 length:240 start_codon:yes stop_codon:yes gene_type:complete